jgi:outer membrane protein assembly factor BamB
MSSPTPESTAQGLRPLRLWPGVAAAVLLLLARLGIPAVWPEPAFVDVGGGIAAGLLIIVWWTFFSRAPRAERWGAIVLMLVALAATWTLADVSISSGAMGALLPMLAVPPLSLALVVWAVASRRLATGPRWATLAATIFIACGAWTLVKTGGFSSSFDNDLMWRWSATPEERLLADTTASLPSAATAAEALPAVPVAPVTIPEAGEGTAEVLLPATPASPEAGASTTISARVEWPGFRGPRRDGIVRGPRIETDWSAHPPVALWRRPVGPGWSSFAVNGDLVYTQEQRGDDEVVASYNLATGMPAWSHRDAVRFWESNGGAGPRGTPTVSNGRIYTFGATGILNAMDAKSGALVWSRNVVTDTDSQVPTWGIASSPLVLEGPLNVVIVGASGTLAAYDLATGKPRWVGPRHSTGSGGSYSSPQRMTIDGVEQVVLLSEAGATGVAPADGKVLWEHALSGSPVLQPVLTADGGLLVHKSGLDGGLGVRRLAVAHEPGGWTATERWTSGALKSMFSDFVIHKGHAFGFDGSILASIDLADGTRTWKGGRYGSGQMVLLPDQDVLLVLSEEGDLALVSATTDRFTELARFKAIEGKTWNHPVLVGDVLLVRNGEEMAAFRLSVQGR